MLLETLVKQVSVLERTIAELNYSMRHASPPSVDALRKKKEELQFILDELMESCVISNFDLEYILTEHDGCLRDCIRPSYTGKPVVLPKPKWDIPPPPPPAEPPKATVPGVNLIVYIDTTGSMASDLAGKLKAELVAFANYLKSESTRAGIPCTCSIVWYGDAKSDGRTTYYKIHMNKEDVSIFPTKIAQPVRFSGGDTPESGILAMKETLNSVYKSGVQNTLIYITDAPSKSNEEGATPSQVKQMFTDKHIQAYSIVPMKKEPIITSFFKDNREYGEYPLNIIGWADNTLRP